MTNNVIIMKGIRLFNKRLFYLPSLVLIMLILYSIVEVVVNKQK